MIGVNTRENMADDKPVLINKKTGRVWIDGEELPFLVGVSGPEIWFSGADPVVTIPVMVIAKSVIIIDTEETP